MRLTKLLPLSLILIGISSVLPWCSLPIGNTFMWWTIDGIILYIFYRLKPPSYNVWQINLFLLCLACSAVYGAIFQTENYWDWKLLVGNLMVFLLPLASYAFAKPDLLVRNLRIWFRYAPLILLILIPFLYSDAFGRYLVPYSFMMLFLPLLNKKYVILTVLAYIITIILGYESRSDMLKFSVCLLLGITTIGSVYTKISKLFKPIYFILLLLPFVLFLLGITGIFNIFRIEEELGLDGKYIMKSGENEFSALVDTRTFLYVEEIESALIHNYVIQGRSIARGYDSISFGSGSDRAMGLNRGERQSCETSILNIFNYFGLIGVFIYFILFSGASYKALFQSNNRYIPIIGLYVAFRWLFAWVEDFSRFDLNYLFLWIMIGMCFSPYFRNMNNSEFQKWIRLIIKY